MSFSSNWLHVLLFFAQQLVSVTNEVTKCTFHMSRYSFIPPSDDQLWVMSSQMRTVTCISRCLSDARCGSVLVNRTTGHCTGLTFTSYTAAVQAKTFDFLYTSSCKLVKHRVIGESCSLDSDCDNLMEGSGCYGGICYCRPRLLYSPSAGACMQCSTFGTTFSVYPDHGVRNNNDVRFYMVAGAEECRRRCLAKRRCRSVEYTETQSSAFGMSVGKTCYASFASLEAMRKGDLIISDNEWILSLRDCL